VELEECERRILLFKARYGMGNIRFFQSLNVFVT